MGALRGCGTVRRRGAEIERGRGILSVLGLRAVLGTNGTLLTIASGPGPSARENINGNGQVLRAADLDSTFYIDADFDESPATYFDDIVLRPTVISVAMAAGLGPRKTP